MNREEAIKVLNSRPYTGEVLEALETLIPELNENTDERIRKWLVGYFTRIGKSWIHREFTCNQIIAYLEKQKEASYAIEAVERIDKYIDEHVANAHDMKDSDPDKKYYRGWDDALGKMSGILQDVYSDEKQKDHFRDDTKMVEQKPAEWSEEELVALKRVGSILRDYGYGELEKIVLMIEGKLANLAVLNKSIWKPSVEQMEALRKVSYKMGNACLGKGFANDENLHSLYVALKKLM